MRKVLSLLAGCVLPLVAVACDSSRDDVLTVHRTPDALLTAMVKAAEAKNSGTLKFVKPYQALPDDAFDGTFRLTGDDLEFSATDSKSGGKTAAIRLVDGVAYELIPPDSATKTQVGCKTWASFAPDSKEWPASMFAGHVLDIRRMLPPWTHLADGRITSSAQQELAGEPVVRYHLDFDLAAMLDRLAEETAPGAAGGGDNTMFVEHEQKKAATVARAFADKGIDSLPVKVWLDGDNLVRKIVMPDLAELSGHVMRADPSTGPAEDPQRPRSNTVTYAVWGAKTNIVDRKSVV